MKFEKSLASSVLLNLLLPGLGHIYWKEYIFGVFVFLITLLATVLFFVSFFIEISFWVVVLLATLPLLFYLFTFLDLMRTVKIKQKIIIRRGKTIIIFIMIGIVYQIFIPIAPVNFVIRNFPEYFIIEDNRLSPLYSKGDLLKTNKLSYLIDIFFIKKPVLHSLPQRYDIVRFGDKNKKLKVGIVLGLPDEEIEIVDGVVIVDGLPDFLQPPGGVVLQGDCQLTYVDGFSILVGTLNLGMIDVIYQVSFSDLHGKVQSAF